MFVFVVPVMSSKVANSWEKVSQLFERCIRSICQQTSNNFRVIVVCHDKPLIKFTHPNVVYIKVNLKIPKSTQEKRLDKGHKVLKGLRFAAKFNPDYTMNVDADDCISKHLVKFIEDRPKCNGWIIKKGHFYKEGARWSYLCRNFDNICGTCNIINYQLYDLSNNLENQQDYIISEFYGDHKLIKRKMLSKGIKFHDLPFFGAIYTLDNGENFYNPSFSKFVPKEYFNYLKSLKNYRVLTSSMQQEFGLYPLKS
ncbi:MAG: glycosyltransferase family A protein [Mastigocoleus sp.]